MPVPVRRRAGLPRVEVHEIDAPADSRTRFFRLPTGYNASMVDRVLGGRSDDGWGCGAGRVVFVAFDSECCLASVD
jgi:hypothetical protein